MNSIRRMYDVIDVVLKWSELGEKNAHGGHKGLVNLGGIRGGHPWRASRTPEKTDLFLDVRVPPTIPCRKPAAPPSAVPRLEETLSRLGSGVRDLRFGARRAHREDHDMFKAIEANHQRIMGEAPKRDVVTWCSDATVLTPLRHRDRELRAFQRAARQRGREGPDQDPGRHHQDLRPDCRRTLRRAVVRDVCQASRKSIAATANSALPWSAESLDALIVCGNQYAGFEGAVLYVSGFEIVHRYVYVVLPLTGEPTLVFPREARWIGDKAKPWVKDHVWPDIPGQWIRRTRTGTRTGSASAFTA